MFLTLCPENSSGSPLSRLWLLFGVAQILLTYTVDVMTRPNSNVSLNRVWPGNPGQADSHPASRLTGFADSKARRLRVHAAPGRARLPKSEWPREPHAHCAFYFWNYVWQLRRIEYLECAAGTCLRLKHARHGFGKGGNRPGLVASFPAQLMHRTCSSLIEDAIRNHSALRAIDTARSKAGDPGNLAQRGARRGSCAAGSAQISNHCSVSTSIQGAVGGLGLS